MKMLEVVEFSPSFSRMSAATIDFAIKHGAAKVDKFLSKESVRNLRENRLAAIPSIMVSRVPEMEEYYRLLGVDDSSFIKLSVSKLDIPPRGFEIHTDGVAANGLTLLMPIEGKKAIFGASNTDFRASDMPGYVVEYGQRDAILLRQRVTVFDGVQVDYKQTWHEGYSGEQRQLAAVDFMHEEITVNRS